jgi:2-oxoglutarate dehydrogenase E2 component (dihydrolipoamide succinyltransferase)
VPSNVVVPQLGESVVEARVARWLKKVGDAVVAGDPLVELETDKIDLEVGAEHSGVLARIDHQAGADVKVGDVLAVVDEQQPSAASAPPKEEPGGAAATKAETPAPRPEAPAAKATATARKVADEHKVDLAKVPGTGDGGRVTKDDVERYVTGDGAQGAPGAQGARGAGAQGARGAQGASAQGASAQGATPAAREPGARSPEPAPLAPRRALGDRSEERVRMSKRRATIARRLVEAQHTAAMLTTFNEVDMSAVMALRARRKEAFQKRHGVGLGLSSFFVKASVGALRAFPRINAEIQGDEMVLKRYYDVGIAVGASTGLVVPVLRDADLMSFAGIEGAIRDFAKRAEDGTLTLEEIKGGTFTITNGGVFGSLLSTPILNPPQVGILGLHKIEERPIAVGGQVVVKPMMYVALSYDHRMVDGLEAVQFLVKVKELIEDPGQMLIEL